MHWYTFVFEYALSMHVNSGDTDWLTFMTVPSAMRRVTGRNAQHYHSRPHSLPPPPPSLPPPPTTPSSLTADGAGQSRSLLGYHLGLENSLAGSHLYKLTKYNETLNPTSLGTATPSLTVNVNILVSCAPLLRYRHAVLFDWLSTQKLSAETVTYKCVHCYPLPSLVFCCLDTASKHTCPGQLHGRGVFHTGRRRKAPC